MNDAGFGAWLYPKDTLDVKAYGGSSLYFYASGSFVDPNRNNGRRNASHPLRCLAIWSNIREDEEVCPF